MNQGKELLGRSFGPELLMANKRNAVLLRFLLRINTLARCPKALMQTNLNTHARNRSFSPTTKHLAVPQQTPTDHVRVSAGTNQRRRSFLSAIIALVLVFGYYTVFMYPTGLSQFKYYTETRDRASPAAKDYVDLSNPVQDWEVDLAQRYKPARSYARELGSELSSRWGVSVEEADLMAWIARMVVYENFLNVYGLWIYLPGPAWTRTAWYRYGNGMVILAITVLLWLRPFWNALERLTAVLRIVVKGLTRRILSMRNESRG